MAKTNHTRIGESLELLNAGLTPFVERELKTALGGKWKDSVKRFLRDDRGAVKAAKKGEINWDSHNLLAVMWDQWNAVFRDTLGYARISWCHCRDIS